MPVIPAWPVPRQPPKLRLAESASTSNWTILFQVLRNYWDRQWVRFGLLITLGIGARLPALQGQLLWDDTHLVVDNPFIKSPLLILEAFRHSLFPDSLGGHYRPVQTTSYIFDYLLWNGESYGFHVSSVLWHVLGACLLYKLLRKLLSSAGIAPRSGNANERFTTSATIMDSAAFFVALLWVVHPVHSAAIDYVSGRADSLTCVFSCSAWLLYLKGRELVRRPFLRFAVYVLAELSFLLAVCSRESGFIWLTLFLFYLFFFDRRTELKSKLLVLACCIALSSVYAGLRQLPPKSPVNDAASTLMAGETPSKRAVLMLRALGDYGQLMIWPANLHMERTIKESSDPRDDVEWRNAIPVKFLALAGVIFGAFLIYCAFRPGPARAIRLFGMTWFVLSYLPISNLVDLNATVAEHWLYLPSIGFFIFVVGCFVELPRQTRKLATIAGCLAVCSLTVRSFIRSSDWVTPETFYTRTLLAGGASLRMAVNLAEIYSQRGENAKAERVLRRVISLDPSYMAARNNLGSALTAQGKAAEAETMFVSASKATPEERENFPRTWAAALNLAHAAHNRNDDKTALTIIDKARQDYPGTWRVISFEAELLRRTQGPAAALPLVQDFVKDNWWHCEASIALGRLHNEMGDGVAAEEAWHLASWLDVHNAEPLNLMALLRVGQNKLEDACQIQRRAIARQPHQPRQYLMLSDILNKLGRTEEAREALAEVSRLESLARSPLVLN